MLAAISQPCRRGRIEGRGGAVFVDGLESCDDPSCVFTGATIRRTYVEENSVEDHPDSRGSAGVAVDHHFAHGQTGITLNGSIVARNTGGREVFFSSHLLDIDYSTITDNPGHSRVITMRMDNPPSLPCCPNSQSALFLTHSTIWEQVDTLGVIKEGEGGALPDDFSLGGRVECFNGETLTLADASVEFPGFDIPPPTLNIDPLFVDPGSGDYHLSALSPLIDRCTDGTPLPADVDREPRGVDDPLTPNNPDQIIDMGADELAPEPPPEDLFSDGFESGNVSAWSASFP